MVAGLVIGVVASLLGVAGGELLIPTLVLLFGADVKLAGSLSLAVSLPTMLVGFTRYSRDRSFAVLGRNRGFVLAMAAGSVAGSFAGGRLLGIVPAPVLLPLLAAILLVSAVKNLGTRLGARTLFHLVEARRPVGESAERLGRERDRPSGGGDRGGEGTAATEAAQDAARQVGALLMATMLTSEAPA